MYCMITVALVGALAWGVAQQVAPAVFAARAELVADGKGRDLTEQELAMWTQSHKALAEDPQVMAAAAENFARRGMPSLGMATAVKQRCATDLYVHSDKPGSLSFELRAPGADRAARELETFLSAVIAVANAQRESRGDGAATAVGKQPVSGADPIDSARLMYAAGIALAGLALAGILAAIGYRILSRAKQRFEDTSGELSAMMA
jgi:hypothetical protein